MYILILAVRVKPEHGEDFIRAITAVTRATREREPSYDIRARACRASTCPGARTVLAMRRSSACLRRPRHVRGGVIAA